MAAFRVTVDVAILITLRQQIHGWIGRQSGAPLLGPGLSVRPVFVVKVRYLLTPTEN